MIDTRNPSASGAMDAPIAGFSQCHVGILNQIDALGELPALIGPAQRARAVASHTLEFFDAVILQHHAEEEAELFTAVLDSASEGMENERVRLLVERLTTEHRQIEAWWTQLKPQLRQVARGHDTELDTAAVIQLVKEYHAHAKFEETHFLPLAQDILGRNRNHMSALGMSLHMRHVKPAVGYI